jgi:hypothetical protein
MLRLQCNSKIVLTQNLIQIVIPLIISFTKIGFAQSVEFGRSVNSLFIIYYMKTTFNQSGLHGRVSKVGCDQPRVYKIVLVDHLGFEICKLQRA